MGRLLSRATTVARGLGPAQDPTLALARGHPAPVEVLEEGDGVLARDAEEILDIARADLLLLTQEGDDLLLDQGERLGVEEERLLHAKEPLALDEHAEELVFLV